MCFSTLFLEVTKSLVNSQKVVVFTSIDYALLADLKIESNHTLVFTQGTMLNCLITLTKATRTII